MKNNPPEEGQRVRWTTVDGKELKGTVDLIMPGQFSVVVDEEFWVYHKLVGTDKEIPTGTYAVIRNDEEWELL